MDVTRALPIENQPVAEGFGDRPNAQARQPWMTITAWMAETWLPGQQVQTFLDTVNEAVRQGFAELLKITPLAAHIGVKVIAAA